MVIFLVVFYLIDHSLVVPLNLKTIVYIAMSMLAVGLGQSIPVITGGIDLSVGGIISLVSVISILFLLPWATGLSRSLWGSPPCAGFSTACSPSPAEFPPSCSLSGRAECSPASRSSSTRRP